MWRVLDAMARRRTLATACEALGAASVKASQAISALERSWGVRLVSRTTHLVGLTLLGAEYAPFFRRIVQYADEISYRADGNSDKGVAFCSVNPWIGILKNRRGALPLDEPRFARATVYSNRELDVSIRINPDPLHYGLPFFKYYDSAAWFLAGRVARLSMAEPGYLRHPAEYSKEAWILTKRDRETLMQVLKSKSQKYLGYSVWQAIIFDYDNEKFYLDRSEVSRCKLRNKASFAKAHADASELIDAVIPIDQVMPDYGGRIL